MCSVLRLLVRPRCMSTPTFVRDFVRSPMPLRAQQDVHIHLDHKNAKWPRQIDCRGQAESAPAAAESARWGQIESVSATAFGVFVLYDS